MATTSEKSLLAVTPRMRYEPSVGFWCHRGREWLCDNAIQSLFPDPADKDRLRLHLYSRPGKDRNAVWIGRYRGRHELVWGCTEAVGQTLMNAAREWLSKQSGLWPRLETGRPLRIYVRAEYRD